MTLGELQTAIARGVTYIAAAQAADGSFQSFSSPTRSPFTPALTYRTTFTPALILGALASLTDASAQIIRQKLADWLLAQKSPHWSFNYWAADAPERQQLRYPDDLDDTFCALVALYQHDPSLVDQTALASAVKLLIATESQVGGPYRTWLTGSDAPKAWQDIDLAVNANVAGFLRLVAEPLPNLTRLMEQAITSRSFTSPYYPSAYPIIYYLARAYDGPLTPKLINYLSAKRRDGWWASPLPTALAVTSLIRFGRADACHEALERLLASQQSDGSWPAEAFCIDPAVQGKTHFSGASTLTTAFVLEALTAFRPAARSPRSKPKNQTDQTATKLCASITAITTQDTRHLAPALRTQIRAAIKRTVDSDQDRGIRLLPYFFHESLAKKMPTASPTLLAALGAANFYGWMAYTIYDNFLDGEGDPKTLSAANTALRYSVAHFQQALPDNAAFQAHINRTFDAIDSANAWELAHCRMATTPKTITVTRLPHYANTLDLAKRSLGHALTPLAILAARNIPPDDPQAAYVNLALRHYIAARQLNDDLHDWEQDLRAGIITYVVARLLHQTAIPPGTQPFVKLVPKLQRQFWHHSLPAICQTVTRHTKLAKKYADASNLLKSTNTITQLADNIHRVVKKTLQEQSNAQAFLAAYTTTITPRADIRLLPVAQSKTAPDHSLSA